ncbi:MAG: YcnI family copper-binding membrane protein [Arachnia sp.]
MHTRSKTRPLMLGSAAALGTLALTFGGTTVANAHVGVTPSSTEAGSYTVLEFGIPHGCDGSSTTKVSIQIPEGIDAVTPTRNALYSVDTVEETLDAPAVDSHGEEVSERVSEIVYTAVDPLPDDQRDTLELSLRLPEEAAGQTLYFPTVQTCEEGEAAWVQKSEDGQDTPELDMPAPEVVVTAPGDDNAEDKKAEAQAGSTQAAGDTAGGESPLIITSLIMGGLGLVVGLIALLRGRRTA